MVVGGRELIDTLWNVNNTGSKYHSNPNCRINRYIMECKLNIGYLFLNYCIRINRYIMECKLRTD